MSSGQSVRWRPEARREVIDARDYYADKASDEVAERFARAVVREVELVSDAPERWREVRPDVRAKVFAPPWPYSLVYAVEPDSVLVLAVAHHRQRPEYWAQRV